MPLPDRLRSNFTVGRTAEIEALRQALDRAAAGQGGAMVFSGQAGIGKTRLILEALHLAREREIPVLLGSATSMGRSTAFAPLTQALRSNLRWRDLPTSPFHRYAAGLRHLLPEWPDPPGDRAQDMTAGQQRLLTFEACLQLILHIAGTRGAVLALEDLHWMDRESMAAISHLAPALSTSTVLLVGSVRPGQDRPVDETLRSLEARGEMTIWRLGSLAPAATAALASAALGHDVPPELLDELLARSGGMPLYVEELLESHVEQGSLQLAEGQLKWLPGSLASVPRTLRATVAGRLTRISPDSRGAVRACAVLGQFDVDTVGAVAGMDVDRVGRALAEAVEVGLLELEQGRLGFRHVLINEAIQDGLLPDQRRTLHLRCAEALASSGGDGERQATHLIAAGERAAGGRLLLAAGRNKLARQSPASAELTLRAALAAADEMAVRAECEEELVEALAAQGRWEECLAVGRANDHPSSSRRLASMARAAAFSNRLDLAARLTEQAEAAGVPAPPLDVLGALVDLWEGRLPQSHQRAARASRAARVVGDAVSECQALDIEGRAADALGMREAATTAFHRWIEVASQSGQTMSLIQAHMEQGNLAFMSGGSDDGLRWARQLAAEHGAYVSQGLADLSLVWWLGHRGLLSEAVELGEEAMELSRRFHLDLAPHASVATAWAMSRRSAGAGDRLLQDALSAAPSDPDLAILAAWTTGDEALRQSDFRVAVARYEGGMAVMRMHPSAVPPPIPFMLVCALACAGDEGQARAALAEAREHPALPRLYVNATWLLVAEALLERSAPKFEAAIQAWENNGGYNQAIALVIAARRIAGEVAGAWLRRALALFDLAGAASDAAGCRRLMRAQGVPVPRRGAPGRGGADDGHRGAFTSREAEVLELVEMGLSNPEIATRLFLSVRTVESHVGALLAKLDVPNRAGLIAHALQRTRRSEPAGGVGFKKDVTRPPLRGGTH